VRAPVEVSETWRAQARQGYSTHSSLIWSAGRPRLWITHLSKVVDKSCLYTCYTLENTLVWLKENKYLEGIRKICLWSDSGPHYRSYLLLSCIITRWMGTYRTDFAVRYGLEKHLKGDIDSHFGLLARRLLQAETATSLTEVTSRSQM
jgi:hypothetical protein